MPTKPPAFQFYAQDWLSSADISLMTLAEEGAYHRLLCWAWTQEDCGLPAEDVALAQLSRLGDDWPRSKERILKKFRLEGGRLYNDRLLVEKRKQDHWREKSARGGRAKALNDIRKGGTTTVPTNGLPLHYKGGASLQSSTSVSNTGIFPTDQTRIISGSFSENSACGAFLKIFTGEKPSGTFQQFLESVPSGEVQICLSHTALWMNTWKYQNGGGKDAVQFLKQGIWRNPPPDTAIQPNGKKRSIADEAKEYISAKERIRASRGSR